MFFSSNLFSYNCVNSYLVLFYLVLFYSIDFTFVVIVFCMVEVSVEVKLPMVSMVDVWSRCSFVISFVIVQSFVAQ